MPHHDDTGDKLEHAYFCYLAEKFEREPELLERPLRTMERWRQIDPFGQDRLDRWEALIRAAQQSRAGLENLQKVLRADDEDTRQFKGHAPFPGVLNAEERKQFICASRH